MKAIRMLAWIACFKFTLYAQPVMSIERSGPSNKVSWTSLQGCFYKLWGAPAPYGPWAETVNITASGERTSVFVPAFSPRTFYRVEELCNPFVSIDVRDGVRLSGSSSVPITLVSGTNQIYYIGLLDSASGRTNTLGTIDIRNPAVRSFLLDTVFLENGSHRFSLEATFGDGSVLDPASVEVVITNRCTIISRKDTEWKRHLEFRPYATSGTYSVSVTDASGTLVQSTNRSIAGALSQHGTLLFEDSSAAWTNVYETPHFDYSITVTPSGQPPVLVSFRSRVLKSANEMEALVTAYLPEGITKDTWSNLDFAMLGLVGNFSRLADSFFLDLRERASGNEYWGPITPTNDTIARCNEYLDKVYLRRPSHLFYRGPGGADCLVERSTLPSVGVSTATLSDRNEKLTFLFLDGFKGARSIVTFLTGITDFDEKLNRADLIREGRRPAVVMFWDDVPEPYASFEDISPAYRDFLIEFADELWKEEPFFPGLPSQTIETAIEKMRLRYPLYMSKLHVAGSTGLFIDEVAVFIP